MNVIDNLVRATDEVIALRKAQGLPLEMPADLAPSYINGAHLNCLVGVVLHHLGLSLNLMRLHNTANIDRVATYWLRRLFPSHEIGLMEMREAITYLHFLQQYNDLHENWEVSQEIAVRECMSFISRETLLERSAQKVIAAAEQVVQPHAEIYMGKDTYQVYWNQDTMSTTFHYTSGDKPVTTITPSMIMSMEVSYA